MINNNFAALYAMGMFRGGIGGYSNRDDRGQPKKTDYVFWLIATIGFILCLIFGVIYFKHMAEEKTYDGVVTYKWKDPCYHKGKFTYNILYMKVKFDSIPVNAYIIVTENTYKTPLHSRVTFTLSNDEIVKYCYPKKETKHMFLWMLYIMYPFIYLLIFFFFGIDLVKYMLGKDSSTYKHKVTQT